MPMWLASILIEKKESCLSETDIELTLEEYIEKEFSDRDTKALVKSITVKEIR